MSEPTVADSRRWTRLYAPGDPRDIAIEHEDALSMFKAAVARAAERPAIHYFDGTLSFGELDALSDALAVALMEHGLSQGDRVALFLQNMPQFLIGELAAWKAGAIAMPINPMNRERELGTLLADAQPKAIISQERYFHDVVGNTLQTHPVPIRISTSELDFQTRHDPRLFADSVRRRPEGTLDLLELTQRYAGHRPPPVRFRAQDVAMLVYTSGTTGVPKGAMNTHGNVTFTAQVYRDWIAVREGAPILAVAPLFHITGLIGHVALSYLVGGPLVLAYRFDPGVMLEAIDEYKPEFTVAAITALIAMMNHPSAKPESMQSFRAIYSGGAPIPPSVVEEFQAKFGKYIRNAYGLTETTSPVSVTPRHLLSPVDPVFGALSVGVPTFNTEVRIVDADSGQILGPGEAGEIVVKGPQVVAGYWNKPEETAKAIRDGWFYTGDIGVLNEEGWLFLVDRKKDMINAAGYKVWPREVEDVLYTHPAVREAAVVGVPDPYRGETVKAVISLKAGAKVTPEEIIEFCKERMAAYKYPRVVEILPELPKTPTGKILRRELRDRPSGS